MSKKVMILEKTIKIQVHLTEKQKHQVVQILGGCRFLYNEYIIQNIKRYEETKTFYFGYEFDKFVNNELSLQYPWLKSISSKARKDTIMSADKALRNYLKHKKTVGFLKLKTKKDRVQSFFFIKDGIRFKDDDESHLWIPILKWIKLKEINYLTEDMIPYITSGRLVHRNDKYYITLILTDYPKVITKPKKHSDGIGIDLGTKYFATLYNGENGSVRVPNPIYSENYLDLELKITSLQRAISHKVEINLSNHGYKVGDKIKKGEATEIYHTHAIQKLQKRINKLHEKQRNIVEDFQKKLCTNLVRANPKFITIEDLDTKEMLQNASHRLAFHIQRSNFRRFREFLRQKCEEYNIELRIADRYFASSKTCSCCGHKKKSLKLSKRIYECSECGLYIDRDENAAINLYNVKEYAIA